MSDNTDIRNGDTAELTDEQRMQFALKKLEHETRAMRKAQSIYRLHKDGNHLSDARLAEKRVDEILDFLHTIRHPTVLKPAPLSFDD